MALMGRAGSTSLDDHNVGVWQQSDFVADYSSGAVSAAEAVLVGRFRGSLNGPVLEIGPGTGRLTRVLVAVGADVVGLDVSPRMVEAARARVPELRAELGDVRDLARFADASFRAVVATDNVLDVLGDGSRRQALAEIARVLEPGGVLLFSTHNKANAPFIVSRRSDLGRALRRPRHLVRSLGQVAGLVRDRRRARRFEHEEPDFAIVSDEAHGRRLAHYYVGRDAQERQLTAAGLTLEACIDADGREVPAASDAERVPHLFFAARR